MGGNAFNFVGRINKEDVFTTIEFMINTLNYPEFNLAYIKDSIMGSAGKKESSGDIDIAMNTYSPKFYGEKEQTVFNKHKFYNRLCEVLPKNQINSNTFRMGNLMSAWPINGNVENGFIQIDYIFGKRDWLTFTHYSPSNNESDFKGVFLQQSYGIIAKMMKDVELFDYTRTEQDGISPLRIGRAGLHLSLELGLFRSWQAEVARNQGPRKVTPEEFETKFDVPRFSRIGYIDDPQTVLNILFKPGVTFEEVNTFEKVVNWLKVNDEERFVEFKERFLNNMTRHKQMLKEISLDEMEEFLLK